MKIICVGRNFVAHAQELKNDIPKEPVIFLKPDTALLKDNAPFYLPDFSSDIHHEVEVVYKICKEGKNIEERFARKYINEVGLGIDFTARDLQTRLKNAGLPWELSKGFNGSAVISQFIPIQDLDLHNLSFSLQKNDLMVQNSNTSLVLFPIEQIISFVSKYFTLKMGDLIYTGTPEGVGPVKIGDRLVGTLEGKEMFNFEIK
ncbi:MAG: fumarylacetoacetate hydrolase family protein [Cytophagales bacterium]|nr:fumarylacetoacetate hydrolase family protein [Cytophagales bacterium]